MSFHIIFLRFYCLFFWSYVWPLFPTLLISPPLSTHQTGFLFFVCFYFSFHLSGQLLMDTCKYKICMDEWDTTWCFNSWVYHIMFKSDSKHLKYCYSSAPCLVGTGRGAVLGIDPRVLLVLANLPLFELQPASWFLIFMVYTIMPGPALSLIFWYSHSFIKQLIISLIFISLISGTEYFFQIAGCWPFVFLLEKKNSKRSFICPLPTKDRIIPSSRLFILRTSCLYLLPSGISHKQCQCSNSRAMEPSLYSCVQTGPIMLPGF